MLAHSYTASVLATGLISGGSFLFIVGIGLGFLFMFISLLPIFSTGMGKSPRHAFHSSLAAAFLVTLVGGPAIGFLFLGFLALPAWYFTRLAMMSYTGSAQTYWRPLGDIITHLSLYACLVVAIIVAYYASEPGGITAIMEHKIRDAFADMPDEYNQVVDTLAARWNFLIFSILAWMWAIALYAHAWIAGRILARQNKTQRPNLAVDIFRLPGWMLYLLAVAALASLIGSDSMRFLGKSCFITLLLPYFFLGLAILHKTCANWPNRRFFLFFIYFLLASQVWAALVLAAVGCIYQVKHLNKGLSSGGTSST